MAIVSFAISADRPAFIRAGHDPATTSVDVDLSTVDATARDLLAWYEESNPSRSGTHVKVAAPTTEALLAALDARRQEEDRKAAQEKDERAAKRANLIAEAHQVIAERRTRTHWVGGGVGASAVARYAEVSPDWPFGVGGAGGGVPIADVLAGTDGAAWLEEIAAENERRRAQAEENRQAAIAAREAAHLASEVAALAGAEALKAWAAENGSRRVQLLIEENLPGWKAVGEDEWLDAHTPAGYAPLPDDLDWEGQRVKVTERDAKTRTKPQEADVLALREARSLCEASAVAQPTHPGVRDQDVRVLSAPKMAWVVLEGLFEDPHAVRIGGVVKVKQKFAAVGLSVTTPTGVTREVWRRVGQ